MIAHRSVKRLTLAAFAIGLLGACATVVDGSQQTLQVTSDPTGATCSVDRHGHTVQTLRTPARLTIDRRNDDLLIICQKESFEDGIAVNPSGSNKWLVGNLILLPLAPVGIMVDAVTGAWNDYDADTRITLEPEPARPPAVSAAPGS